MKKRALARKLTLSTETLRHLNAPNLEEAAGGYNYSTGAVCNYHSKGQVTNCSLCPGCTI